MSRSEWIEPPEVYTFIPLRTQKYVKCSNKKYILYIIFGCLLLLIITIILFKSLYHQKQTTTMTKKISVLTTASTLRNQVSTIFNNAQCPASNCRHGSTCCLSNQFLTKMRCCNRESPVCCSPDQGWCCWIHAPVCCGKFGCCPLNTRCCMTQGIEECCPIDVNDLNTTISATVK